MTPEEFRAAGHALIDWIADYRAGIADLPVQAQVRPGEVAARLPGAAPAEPQEFDDVLRDLDDIVLPGVGHLQHPRFFGWFPANASLASVLGDVATAGLGTLGLSWQSAPALTELEEVVVGWMQQEAGLPPSWRGVMQDTASSACLVALLAARERASDFSETRGGLQAQSRPLVVYTTEHAHSSVLKAAALAGFGADNLCTVASDPWTRAMVPAAFAAAVEADRAAGRQPTAVVVSLGTTGTTAVDPLAEIAPVARGHDIWVHVDAAMGGTALVLPEMRWMTDGLAEADSLTWNLHKWFGTVFECSLMYLADP